MRSNAFQRVVLLVLVTARVVSASQADAQGEKNRSDIVVESFDGPDYGEWTTSGSIFGDGPITRKLTGRKP